ncbi:sodium-dependent nutrient amino acid transporter 1-like isoform X7 [Dermacentor andersoni]|uniref:sodium-dependent nutrient amino acid transporter 1-like isoform X7 n=1 Tax=Dermacentor andersoni TaxID=34620 RepID=UPI0024179770|nr:sodium-dependent nutrient amino acid transporter 1-like isoform X7 [Dermacentor andersoni]
MADVERQKWSNKIEFILSSIGLSVGLGNVWRFPYVAFDNGGGAFMVPYIVLMLVLGRPMYYLELVLGQFASNAQARAFGGFPLAKGVGWAMVYACAFISLYYNVILGYALLYLVYSFSGTLPWTSCDYSDWADSDCYNPRPGVVPCRTVEPRLLRLYAGENYTGPDAHAILHGSDVVLVPRQAYELLANSCTMATQTAPEQFFYRHVLGLSSGIEDLGSLQPRLAIALVVSWLCVYLCIFKGIKSAGKAVYVTSLAPFLILGMLFVRGITLPGASDGIRFYLVPDWSIIMRARVWKNAAEQIFYSLSLAEGMIICFGGFNEFRNRLHKDVLVVAAADFVVSLMGGMVVFSVLGNMAYNMDVPVNDVVSSVLVGGVPADAVQGPVPGAAVARPAVVFRRVRAHVRVRHAHGQPRGPLHPHCDGHLPGRIPAAVDRTRRAARRPARLRTDTLLRRHRVHDRRPARRGAQDLLGRVLPLVPHVDRDRRPVSVRRTADAGRVRVSDVGERGRHVHGHRGRQDHRRLRPLPLAQLRIRPAQGPASVAQLGT